MRMFIRKDGKLRQDAETIDDQYSVSLKDMTEVADSEAAVYDIMTM